MKPFKSYKQMIAEGMVSGKTLILKSRCQGRPRMFYKLDENKNVVPSSMEEWATFIENKLPTNLWNVGKDTVNNYDISTVFFGLCHNFYSTSNIPLVFETMVFDKNKHGIYQSRSSTWKQAEEGHQEAIEWVKNGCKKEFE